jgi:hypothetical protein
MPQEFRAFDESAAFEAGPRTRTSATRWGAFTALQRSWADSIGHPAGEEPYVQPRDTRMWGEEDRRRLES